MAVNRPDFINQLLEMWGRLAWRQRTAIIAFAALGVVLILSVVYFVNRVEYQTLYRDLDPEDAQAITARLEENRRSFRVKGTSVLVAAPKEEIDKMRLELSGAGLGRSGVIGYEIFDKSQFGMTDFVEQVNLQRALEGELARTISYLAEISRARVHIVLPKESYFEEKERAKASVFLTLKKGASLSRSGIAGIRGVVAGAVPGLSIQNISIMDDEGRVLAQSMESSDIARSELESGAREQMEKELANKAIAILEPFVGRKNIQASASVEMDSNTMEQTEEMFNPSTVVSHQRSEERAGGAPIGVGVPGTQSNVGTAAAVTLAGPERIRENEITNYEVSKTVRYTVQPKGIMRRLSVAVTLNDKMLTTREKDGSLTTKTEPLSESELGKYRELVMAAVGFDEQRGDVVTLKSAPFYNDTALEETPLPGPWYVQIQNQSYFVPAVKYGALAILFLLAYLIFVRPLRNRVFQAIDASVPEVVTAGGDRLELGEMSVAALPGVTDMADMSEAAQASAIASLSAANPDTDGVILDMDNASDEQIELMLADEENSAGKDKRRYAVIKKKLVEKAIKDPEMISRLIRSMMQERAQS